MDVDIFAKVEKNYKDNFEKLGDKRFHFASRLFLWSGDEFAKEKLKQLKNEYIGSNANEYFEKIKGILEEDLGCKNLLFKEEREDFFEKYSLLKKYNKILFKNLFCETIYGISLREIIDKNIPKEDFIKLRENLLKDAGAIASLSTHAINYFYVLKYYFKEKEPAIDRLLVADIVASDDFWTGKSSTALKVYLLTHCIIGESQFYSKSVKGEGKKTCEKFFSLLESIISEDYANVSLDNKVEFLVCAKICHKESYLKEKILLDTLNSFDSEKNYFLKNRSNKSETAFVIGEHRNILALMAFYLEFKLKK